MAFQVIFGLLASLWWNSGRGQSRWQTQRSRDITRMYNKPPTDFAGLNQDDFECEERIDMEFQPPLSFGPVWQDNEATLRREVPRLCDVLQKCFYSQKERPDATTLLEHLLGSTAAGDALLATA